MAFKFEKLSIEDVILIKPEKYCDERGFFMETYKKSDFIKAGIKEDFIQDNFSKSKEKVLRGLHYQIKPYLQSKLIRCTKGKILDIAVDLRENSKTFKKYIKAVLSEENSNILYVPKGFAHGFLTLSKEAEINYKTSSEFNPLADRGILWSDEDINIDWGIDFEPILSDKDKNLPKSKEINYKELF